MRQAPIKEHIALFFRSVGGEEAHIIVLLENDQYLRYDANEQVRRVVHISLQTCTARYIRGKEYSGIEFYVRQEGRCYPKI